MNNWLRRSNKTRTCVCTDINSVNSHMDGVRLETEEITYVRGVEYGLRMSLLSQI